MEQFPDAEAQKCEEEKRFNLELVGREEYREGLVPLEFRTEFSNDRRLDVAQDEEGIAHIVIEKPGGDFFDFNALLPQEFKYITPTYIKKHEQDLATPVWPGTWGAYQNMKLVSVGDWTRASHVFNLLHEVGHTTQDVSHYLALRQNFSEKMKKIKKFSSTPEGQAAQKEYYTLQSELERQAWASALHAARFIRETVGIDLVNEVFPDNRAVEEYIDKMLHTYKTTPEQMNWSEGREFLKKLFDKER